MRRMRWFFPVILLLLGAVYGETNDFDNDDSGDIVHNEIPEEEETLSYKSPAIENGKYYFAEHFDDLDEFSRKWIKSQAKKEDAAEDIAKYDGVWEVEAPKRPILRHDYGLVLKSKAKHAAIAAQLNTPFVFYDKPLIVQYEVTLQEGQECGGAYIKLLSSGKETTHLRNFHDKTPYTIMFGPDKCGNDIKLHFIFRHNNPINGTITEKHCKKPKDRLQEPFSDKEPHLYQLLIRPDNTFEIRVDHKLVNEGSLLKDFTPPVNPPKEIDDPEDHKPTDWDEREKIPDPAATKPDDWDEDAPPQIPDSNAVKPEDWLDDEEEMIHDPNAEKPADWDQDMDGEWEAPLIPNPACEKAVGCGLWKSPLVPNPNYKGKWRAQLIENPNYQGKWAPRKIPNPDFFEDLNPFQMTAISAVGIELWSMSSDILFDNFIITDDPEVAHSWASQTYDLKRKQIDKEADTMWEKVMKHLNYKPGWWFVYFVYCLIPIVGYGWYLKRRYNKDDKETFVSRLVKFTNDNPWMWAVYVIVIGLPLALIIFFVFSSKDKVDNKKTDDVKPNENEEEEEEAVEDDEQNYKQKLGKSKKSDLDEPPTTASNNSDSEAKEDEIDDEEDNNVEEVEENVEVKPQKNETEVPSNEGTRKRKPRRE